MLEIEYNVDLIIILVGSGPSYLRYSTLTDRPSANIFEVSSYEYLDITQVKVLEIADRICNPTIFGTLDPTSMPTTMPTPTDVSSFVFVLTTVCIMCMFCA